MIHTASLIHDDVLDESDMRRGNYFKILLMPFLLCCSSIHLFIKNPSYFSISIIFECIMLLPTQKISEAYFVLKYLYEFVTDMSALFLVAYRLLSFLNGS